MQRAQSLCCPGPGGWIHISSAGPVDPSVVITAWLLCCWSEPGPAAPRGTGQPEQSADEAQLRLQKDTSGPCLWLDILSSATSLLLSRLCFSAASSSGVKPCIQQTHSVLKFHLVPTYFWDIVALDLGGCEVQKDTGSLAVELNGPG